MYVCIYTYIYIYISFFPPRSDGSREEGMTEEAAKEALGPITTCICMRIYIYIYIYIMYIYIYISYYDYYYY